jgi:glutathione S-transferase
MASLKIYGVARSRAARNVWCAEECGAEYDLVKTPIGEGGSRKPEFLAINPMGTVPAMQDGPLTLTESLAIDLYIAKKYGAAKGFYPSDLAGEAKVWQWTLFGATEIEPKHGIFAANTFMKPEAERDKKAASDAWTGMGKAFGVLDKLLAKQPWLLGNAFTVADVNVAGVLTGSYASKVDFGAWPNLKAWLDRAFGRPAGQKILAMRAAG